MYSIGTELWTYVASLVFVISMLLDRADGILARLSSQTTPWGHTYDLICDSISNSFAFVGIGIGLRESELGFLAIPIGMVAGISISAVLWLVMRVEDQKGTGSAELGGLAGFDPDDAILVVPFAMVFGWGAYLIIAGAIGASIFALFFFWKFRKTLFGK